MGSGENDMGKLAVAGLAGMILGGITLGAPALAKGEFAGAWAVEVNTGQGAPRTAVWTVTKSGATYAIEIAQNNATDKATDVTFDGEKFTFKRQIPGDQPVAASYEGAVDGDALKGEVDVGGTKYPVTAKRK
jgi:hypothetical protein